MMRSIISAMVVLHRWLGIACCLLFAMWFATGMVIGTWSAASRTGSIRRS